MLVLWAALSFNLKGQSHTRIARADSHGPAIGINKNRGALILEDSLAALRRKQSVEYQILD